MSSPTKRELAEALRAALQNCVAGGKGAAEVLERYDATNQRPKAGDIVRLKVDGCRGRFKGKFGVLQGSGPSTFGVHVPGHIAPGEDQEYAGPYGVEQFEVVSVRDALRALQKSCPEHPSAVPVASCPDCGCFIGA